VIRIEIGRRNYLLYLCCRIRLKSRKKKNRGGKREKEKIARSTRRSTPAPGASAYDRSTASVDEAARVIRRATRGKGKGGGGEKGKIGEGGRGGGFFTTLIAAHAGSYLSLSVGRHSLFAEG